MTECPAETGPPCGRPELRRPTAGEWRRTSLEVGGLLLLALFLRCHNLPNESVWLDEYYSAAYLKAPSLSQFIRDQRPENFEMVPVYYTIEYYWARLFGPGIVALRALSVLFGASTLCLIYALGRRLQGRATGIVAGALYALSPYMIHHDQYIRPYPLMTLLGLASSWLLLRHLQETRTNTDGHGPARETSWQRYRWLIADGAANALLMGTHLFGVLFAAPQAIALLGHGLAVPGKEKREPLLAFAVWSAWHALILLLIIRWIFPLPLELYSSTQTIQIKQVYGKLFETDPTYIFWTRGFPDKTVEVDLPGWTRLLLGRLFAMTDLLGYLYAIGVAFAMWCFVREWRVHRVTKFVVQPSGCSEDPLKVELRTGAAPWTRAYLVLWFVLPACLLFLFARFREPLAFQDRYFIYCFPALYLLAGIGAARLRPTVLRAGYIIALVCMLGGQTLLGASLPMRTDYLGVARLIAREAGRDDEIFAFDWSLKRVLVFNMGPDAHPVQWNQNADQTWQDFEAALDQERRVWVVTNSDPEQGPIRRRIEEVLMKRGAAYSRTAFLGTLNLYLYVSPPLHDALVSPPSRSRTEVHGATSARRPVEAAADQGAAPPRESRSAT